jgi:hypothetical protein
VLFPEAGHLEPSERVADEHRFLKVKRVQNGHDVIDVVIEGSRTYRG